MKRRIIPAVFLFLILGFIGMAALYLSNTRRPCSHDASEFYLAIYSGINTGICQKSLPMRGGGVSLFVSPPVITGNDASAAASFDQASRPSMMLHLSEAGTVAVREAVGTNVSGMMAVIHCGEIVSQVYIGGVRGDHLHLTGDFTQDDIREFMSCINGD